MAVVFLQLTTVLADKLGVVVCGESLTTMLAAEWVRHVSLFLGLTPQEWASDVSRVLPESYWVE